MTEAEVFLSRPLKDLNKLLATWKARRRQTTPEEFENAPRTSSSFNSDSSRRVPRSECSKELQLLASSNPKAPKPRTRSMSFRNLLPDVAIRGRVRTFNARNSREHEPPTSTNPYAPVDDVFEKELQELVENGPEVECLCHTGHLCFIHAEGHPSNYEGQSSRTSRPKLGKRLQSGVKTFFSSI